MLSYNRLLQAGVDVLRDEWLLWARRWKMERGISQEIPGMVQEREGVAGTEGVAGGENQVDSRSSGGRSNRSWRWNGNEGQGGVVWERKGSQLKSS